ncbi:uncharacterized protein [Choristoneura fumiferana]|uniref:uncharacterized protein n=1 Tax=Choristoneura fumiferana TaxID=7141 RepID=UPI003D15D6A5
MFVRQIALLMLCCALAAHARPDGGDTLPLPGPGLSYGGIPYGSMSGNVAEYFKRQAPSNGRSGNLAPFPNADLDFAPIEQWL